MPVNQYDFTGLEAGAVSQESFPSHPGIVKDSTHCLFQRLLIQYLPCIISPPTFRITTHLLIVVLALTHHHHNTILLIRSLHLSFFLSRLSSTSTWQSQSELAAPARFPSNPPGVSRRTIKNHLNYRDYIAQSTIALSRIIY